MIIIDGLLKEFNQLLQQVYFEQILFRGPVDADDLILISMLKNEAWRLPCFLEHYRKLGIKRFVLIDNNSTDNIKALVADEPDIDLYSYPAPFLNTIKQAVLHKVLRLYGPNRWVVSLDLDELLVFQGMEQHRLKDLSLLAEKHGLFRIRGMMVDLYSNGVRDDYKLMDDCHKVMEQCKFFDTQSFKQTVRRYVSIKGGARGRLRAQLGRHDKMPEMTKYPLFYFREKDVFIHAHYMRPYSDNFASECLLGILHYKFSKYDFLKLEESAQDQVYGARRKFSNTVLEWFDTFPEKSMVDEQSAKYDGPGSLISTGIISPINWGSPATAFEKLNPFSLAHWQDKLKRKRILKMFKCKIREFFSPNSNI